MGTKGTVLEDTEETVEETPGPGEVEHESPEESVRLAIEELQKENNGEEDQATEAPEPVQASTDSTEQVVEPKQAEKEPQTAEIELDPPERLNAMQRAVYKRSSPAMKKVFHEVISDLESRSHKAMHAEKAEVMQKQQKYRDLDAVLDPYRKELLARGHSDASAVAELLEIHKGLSNPQTKDKVFEKLGADIGYDWSRAGASNGEVQGDVASHPYVKSLESKILDLQKKIEPVHNHIQSQTQQAQAQTIQEMNQEYANVGAEVDKSGQLAYPKLTQDPQYFDQRLRPLVISLMQSDSNRSFGDAVKMAYNITEGRFGYLQNHQGQTRPSPQQKQNTNRPISPPLSVRGKSTQVADLPAYDEDIRPGETPEESVRIAVERLARGVH